VVFDDAIRNTSDFGARTFDYGKRTLQRDLFVGTIQDFHALQPAEQQEVKEIAKAALHLINERGGKVLLDLQHREVLTAFLGEN